jgi:hypothetical protein
MKKKLLALLLVPLCGSAQTLNTYNNHDELAEAPADGDFFPLWDVSANATKKVSRANLLSGYLSGSITGTRVLYGNGAGGITSELAFSYSAVDDRLAVGSVFLGSYMTLQTTGSNLFSLKGNPSNEELSWNLSTDDVLVASSTGVNKVTFVGIDVVVPDEAYDAAWNGSNEVPTKNALWDKIEALVLSGGGGSGNVTKVGTPVNNQIGVWTGDGTIEGDSAFTFNSANDELMLGRVLVGGATGMLISSPAADHIALTADGTGDELVFDFDTDNTTRVYSGASVNNIVFDAINLTVPTEVYDSTGWNGDLTVPTKDAVRDVIVTLGTGSMATDAIWDAKGDLAVGTGANTSARLPIGANGTVPIADSAEATGIRWGAAAGTGDVTAAANFGTDNRLLRSDGTAKGAQASAITVDDSGNVTGVAALTVTTLNTTTLDAGNLLLTPTPDIGYSGTLLSATLTDARVWTFPDVEGTVLINDGGPVSVNRIPFGNGSNGTTTDSVFTYTTGTDTLAVPNLTLSTGGALGASTATTPAVDDDSTKVATTAYVQDEIAGLGGGGATIAGNRQNVFEWDEMGGTIGTSSTTGPFAWVASTASGGVATAGIAMSPTDATSPGAGGPGVTTASSSRAGFTGQANILFGGGAYTLESRVGFTDIAATTTEEYTARIGYIDSASTEPVDGAFFRYSYADASWFTVCRSNNTETTFDTGVDVVADTWYRLNIVVNAAANSVEFRINGTLVRTETANIPSGNGRHTQIGASLIRTATAGTQNLNMVIDYVGQQIDLTAAR